MRDGERATGRQNRLGEAQSTVPGALLWLMLATVGMILAIVATSTAAAVGPRVHVGIVVAAATAFASTLLLVRDLDQPYAGSVRRAPTQTAFVRAQIAAEVRGGLPCNAAGLPTGDPGLRAGTAPLG